MTTPYNLISLALQDSGVLGQGQTAKAQDMNNGLIRLNQMIGLWNKKRWLVFHLVTTTVVSTGNQTYIVGPGGDFNIPRTDRLEAGYLIQTNSGLPVSYPLEILQSMEDYTRIRLKTLTSFPGALFLDTGWPTGTLYPWPIPLASIYSIAIVTKAVLPAYTALNQDIDLPPEYENAINYNLQARFRAAYRLPADPVIDGLAKDGLNVIRGANAQVPRLIMPGAVTRRGPGYNILGDQP